MRNILSKRIKWDYEEKVKIPEGGFSLKLCKTL